MNWKIGTGLGIFAFVAMILFFNSVYTIEEGHIGVVKRFGKATSSSEPGLHFKTPFSDSIEEIEIRTKKSSEALTASTFEQMPTTVTVSVNWTVQKTSAFDLYVKYGGLEQFEERILDTRLRSAAKNAISKFKAEEIIQNRMGVIAKIEEGLKLSMSKFPISLDSVQIDNLTFPKKYMASIQVKQTEKNLAAAEQHKLARQKLEAQRDVNTAEAKRDASKATADGKAYTIETEAAAEAKAVLVKGKAAAAVIKLESEALKLNPDLIKLRRVQKWDGSVPRMTLGGNAGILLNIDDN